MASGKKFFTEEERAAVIHAITEAERHTTGEIIFVVVGRSDPYPGARWLFAVCVALLAALLLYWFAPSLDPIWYLLAQLPALALGHLLAGLDVILRLFLNDGTVEMEVEQRAFEAFAENGVSNTRDHTGILLFVSHLERRVIVLADSGINARVPPGTWDEIVKRLIERMHASDLGNALSVAVRECGKILTNYFPAEREQLNELPDHLVVED